MSLANKLVSIANNTLNIYNSGKFDAVDVNKDFVGKSQGTTVSIDDISPVSHIIDVKLTSKNLLNLNRTLGTLKSGLNGKRTDFEFDKYYEGITRTNIYIGRSYATATIDNGVITVNSKNAYYGIGIPFKVKPNTSYILSGTIAGDSPYTRIAYYDNEGNYLTMSGYPFVAFTTPENCTIAMLSIVSQIANSIVTATDMQIEEGTTATNYTPYIEDCSTILGPAPNLIASGFPNSNSRYIASNPFYLENGKTYRYEIITNGVSLHPVFCPEGWDGYSTPILECTGNSLEFKHIYETADNWVLYLDTTVDDIISASLVEIGANTVEPVTIKVSGKNLFNGEEIIRRYMSNEYEVGEDTNSYKVVDIQLKPNTKYIVKINGEQNGSATFINYQKKVNTTSGISISPNWTKKEQVLTTNDDGKLYFGYYGATRTEEEFRNQFSIALIQIEYGTTANLYEEYIEPVEYNVTRDGTVQNVKSIYPTTVLSSNNEAAVINTKYIKDIDKVFENIAIDVSLSGGE